MIGQKRVSRKEIASVAALLERAYPYVTTAKRGQGVFNDTPLSALIRAILSQRTTDVNRDRAFHMLRERYPSWEAVARAPVTALERTIRETNYADVKAERIQMLLDAIKKEHGEYTLDFLRDWPTECILDYLQSFRGVGPKSAATVCLFALGRPVMPVDVHVFRVTQRLAWIPAQTTPERAHVLLQRLIPCDLILPVHVGMWQHGHTTCRPKPKCAQCAIYRYCRYAAKTAPEPSVDEAIAMTAGIYARAA